MKRTATEAVKQFRCKYGNYKIKEDGVKINKPWKSAETVGLMAYLKSDSAIKKLKKICFRKTIMSGIAI